MAHAKITLESLNEQLQEILKEETKIYPIRIPGGVEHLDLICTHHFLNTESIDSINILANRGRPLDIGIIGRSMFEAVLNMGLLLHLPNGEGASRYGLYRSVESQKMYTHMAEIEPDTARKIYKLEDIANWLRESGEYERLYGKITSSWSGKSAVDACKILDGEYPPVVKSKHFFEFLYCQIYRHGSSATHRTAQGISRHLTTVSVHHKYGGIAMALRGKEEGLVFNYFHSLIVFLCSMRIVGRAFDIRWVEDYFQQKVGFLIAGYPETQNLLPKSPSQES